MREALKGGILLVGLVAVSFILFATMSPGDRHALPLQAGAPRDTVGHGVRVDSVLSEGERILATSKDAALPGGFLREVVTPLTDAQLARAESLRARSGRRDARTAAAARLAARRAYPPILEDRFLDVHIDAHVKAIGESATVLRIDYEFATRVFGHEFEKRHDLFDEWRAMGFRRVELVGYDYSAAWEL